MACCVCGTCGADCRRVAAFGRMMAGGAGVLVDARGRCDGVMAGAATGGCIGPAGDCARSVTGGDMGGGGGSTEVFFQVSSNKAYVDASFV